MSRTTLSASPTRATVSPLGASEPVCSMHRSRVERRFSSRRQWRPDERPARRPAGPDCQERHISRLADKRCRAGPSFSAGPLAFGEKVRLGRRIAGWARKSPVLTGLFARSMALCLWLPTSPITVPTTVWRPGSLGKGSNSGSAGASTKRPLASRVTRLTVSAALALTTAIRPSSSRRPGSTIRWSPRAAPSKGRLSERRRRA